MPSLSPLVRTRLVPALLFAVVACAAPVEDDPPVDADDRDASTEAARDGERDTSADDAVSVAPLPAGPALAPSAYSDGTADRCNLTLMKTDKSYAVGGPGGHFTFQIGVVRCRPYGIERLATDERMVFEYRYAERPSDEGPGYLYLDPERGFVDPKSGAIAHAFRATGSFEASLKDGRFDFDLSAERRHLMLAFRARPKNRPEIGFSEWVRINYNTRRGLLDGKVVWPFQNGGVAGIGHFAGVNYMSNSKPFRAVYATWTPEWPDRFIPTTRAKSLNVYLKDNAYGYHHPKTGFARDAAQFWGSGLSDCLFWLDIESQPGHRPEERILVSNAFTMLQWKGGDVPTFADGRPWWDGNIIKDDRNWVRGVSSGDGSRVCSGTAEQLRACRKKPVSGAYDPLNEQNYQMMRAPDLDGRPYRNYTLLPEFVAEGWGVAVPHFRGKSNWLWVAHGSVLPRRALKAAALPPGASWDDPVYHVAYYETATDAFSRSPSAAGVQTGGHREDWFLDGRGASVLRIEGRAVGAAEVTPQCAGPRCTRHAPNDDPDFINREVIREPHYCTTRKDAGTCNR